jgi:hypothetical protein
MSVLMLYLLVVETPREYAREYRGVMTDPDRPFVPPNWTAGRVDDQI